METFINILEVALFVVKMAFSISIVLLVAGCGVWASDEIKEMRAERSIELATNREDLRQLRTNDVTPFTEWVAQHRRPKVAKEESATGRHRVIKGEPSYSSRTYAFMAPKQPIFNDDNFFTALINEREELAPLF